MFPKIHVYHSPNPSRIRPVDNSIVRIPDPWSAGWLIPVPLAPPPLCWCPEDAAPADDREGAAAAFWFGSCGVWRTGPGAYPLALAFALAPLTMPLPDALRLTCVLSVVRTAGATSGGGACGCTSPGVAAVVEETAGRWGKTSKYGLALQWSCP